ncbi:MAG TPA: hypothetical protein VHB46_04305 [Burkholderiales bacterium]|nr:hypothetical protein [Burkholderiales bacterium]
MDDSIIWRYMDFSKYVDLISTREMFFCRSDLLGDPFEGSSTEKHHERRIEEIRRQANDFQREVTMYVIAGMDYRKYVYVNCWHMSEYESAALWRLYLKSDEGIAIQSTRNFLSSAVSGNKYGVWSVPVKYIDYFNDDPPMPTRMAAFRYKRKSFEHEKELRAIVYADVNDETGNRLEPPATNGVRVNTNLERLITAIHLAPTAPDWLYDLTLRITRKFQIDAPVLRSSLTGDDSLFI